MTVFLPLDQSSPRPLIPPYMVHPSNLKLQLLEVVRAVMQARRIVVICGAGISVQAGIPDFRSPEGLFKRLQQDHPTTLKSGKDLFDASVFRSASSTSMFCKMICELSKLGEAAIPTPFHQLLHGLNRQGKLLRVYTQNIDGLEFKAGLTSGVPQLPVKRDFSHRPHGLPKCIPLHGTLKTMHCEHCTFSCGLSKYRSTLELGALPLCPACVAMEDNRRLLNKRPHGLGNLRPSVVLYNEPHTEGEIIGDVVLKDLEGRARGAETGGADFLLVVGTSLKIPGTTQMVRDFSRVVHSRTAKTLKGATSPTRTPVPNVVYLNLDFPVPTKAWKGVFDVWVQGDVQTFASMLQNEIKGDIEKRDAVKKRKREFEDGSPKEGKRMKAEATSVPKMAAKKHGRSEEEEEPGGGKMLVATKKQRLSEEDGKPGFTSPSGWSSVPTKEQLDLTFEQPISHSKYKPIPGTRTAVCRAPDARRVELSLKTTNPSGGLSVPTKEQPNLTLGRPISFSKYKQTPGTRTVVSRAPDARRVEPWEYSELLALCPALCRLLESDREKEGEDKYKTWVEIKHCASIMIAQTQQPGRAQKNYEPPSSWGL